MLRPVLLSLLLALPLLSCSCVKVLQAQDLLLSIQANAAGLSAPAHIFGFSESALTGPDQLDVPEPPHPPSEYLALAFRMLTPPAPLPNRYRDDVRAAVDFADQSELWELHVETDRIGADCTLTVSMVSPPIDVLHLRIIPESGGKEIVVPLPGSTSVTLDGPDTTLWLELTADVPVGAKRGTWGAVKSIYLR